MSALKVQLDDEVDCLIGNENGELEAATGTVALVSSDGLVVWVTVEGEEYAVAAVHITAVRPARPKPRPVPAPPVVQRGSSPEFSVADHLDPAQVRALYGLP